MTREIPPHLLEPVYAHARAEYPNECVGLLLGPAADCSIVDEVRVCENAQDALHERDPLTYPRDARRAYNLGARDTIFFHESFNSSRPVKIVYHSHADVGAYFSEEDKRMALAFADDRPAYDLAYLVIDVRSDGVAGAKLFRWDEAAGDFTVIAEFLSTQPTSQPAKQPISQPTHEAR